MIEKLKMPFEFDAAALKADLREFSEEDWTPHFNTSYYEGDWSGIALRAAKDVNISIYPDPTAEEFEETDFFKRCRYIPEVLNIFQCQLETVRFLRLGAYAKILEHQDYMLGFENGVARVHIPVVTNPNVVFRLNGETLKMKEGEAWYLNFNLPHSVENPSPNVRVHLVIDCLVNDWMNEIFKIKEGEKV